MGCGSGREAGLKPAVRDLLVAAPLALIFAVRGAVVMATGSAWTAPKHGPPHLLEGRQAVLFGLAHCALALLILSAWLAFSSGYRRAGLIGMVGAAILAISSFAGSLV